MKAGLGKDHDRSFGIDGHSKTKILRQRSGNKQLFKATAYRLKFAVDLKCLAGRC